MKLGALVASLLSLAWFGLFPSVCSQPSLDSLKMELISSILETTSESALLEASRSLSAGRSGAVAVVGGGLSGLTSTLELLEGGYEVVLIDRSDFLGGNSAKV